MNRIRYGKGQMAGGNSIFVAVAIITITYMGVIAVARNDNQISVIKSEVLASYFHFHTPMIFDWITNTFGAGVNSALVEGLVYLSSPIVLFDKFLDTNLGGISLGSMDFPFFFRQIQPLTGINVLDLYSTKVSTMQSQGIIGVGWTTAPSSLIMDFGYFGAAIALILQGAYSAFTWRRVTAGGDFQDTVLAIIMLDAAVYMPLFPVSTDNNVLFLFIFCFIFRASSGMRRKMTHGHDSSLRLPRATDAA